MINSDILILGTGDLAPLTSSGAIGTAVATVDKYSSMRLPQAIANLDFTIPAPTTPFIGQQFELINTGTVAFTVTGVQLGIGQAGLWVWSGTAWARIAPDQRTISGNTIALALSKPVNTVVTFDNINVRFGNLAIAPDLQIASVSGTRNIRYLCEHEYPGGSFSIGTTFAAPIALGTTYVTIGDPIFVANERAIVTLIDESTGSHYVITAWFYATGVGSIIVEKIGLTTSTILPTGLVRCLARARVDIGDAVAAGARPLSNVLNVASATGSGAGLNATLTVVFATPLPLGSATAYDITGTLYSNVAAGAINDNTVNWTVQSQSLTGFVIMFRELSPVLQNLSFSFRCDSLT